MRSPAAALSLLLLALLLLALPPLAMPRPGRAAIPPLWQLTRSLPALGSPALSPSAPAPAPAVAATPGQLCRAAIDAAERAQGIPPHLMAAIGRIESGQRNAAGGTDPWPWSIDAEGVDHVYATEAEAIAAVRAFQAQGMRSIDVGCLQVNLMFHPYAFASLAEAFDPARNAAYAARFLASLHAQTGNWAAAVADYHSATPALGADYQRRVMAVLPDEQQRGGGGPPAAGLPAAGLTVAGLGAYMLATHPALARMLPLPVGAVGRGLDAYRAHPVPLAGVVGLR